MASVRIRHHDRCTASTVLSSALGHVDRAFRGLLVIWLEIVSTDVEVVLASTLEIRVDLLGLQLGVAGLDLDERRPGPVRVRSTTTAPSGMWILPAASLSWTSA